MASPPSGREAVQGSALGWKRQPQPDPPARSLADASGSQQGIQYGGPHSGSGDGRGRALAAHAASDVRILVVGNPCNTNCLVAYHNGRSIPAERWTAMTRLDHNRARTALAKKAGVANEDVTQVTIWGNHSNTQYPDFSNAKIKAKPATEVITDRNWLENVFVPQCQNRGAAVIKARGSSSALSAANGALDHVKSLLKATHANDWLSAAVISKANDRGPAGLVFSYPCRSDGKGNYQ